MLDDEAKEEARKLREFLDTPEDMAYYEAMAGGWGAMVGAWGRDDDVDWGPYSGASPTQRRLNRSTEGASWGGESKSDKAMADMFADRSHSNDYIYNGKGKSTTNGGMRNMIPKLILTAEVHEWIDDVVAIVPAEVGGVGFVTQDDHGNLVVDEVFLMEQTVSGASVDFAPDAVVKAMEYAIEQGRIEDLRFSWHSHADLGVGWSGTDERGIDSYMRDGLPWLASYVTNKDGDQLARIDIQGVPVLGGVTLKMDVVREQRPDEIDDDIVLAVQDHVKIKTWNPKPKWKDDKDDDDRPGPKRPTGASKQLTKVRGGKRDDMPNSVHKLDCLDWNCPGCAEVDEDDELESVSATHPRMDEAGTPNAAGWTPRELTMLIQAGYDPQNMSDDEILDAVIKLEIQEFAGEPDDEKEDSDGDE